MSAPATAPAVNAEVNRAYIRRLLARDQPGFAAALEAAVSDLGKGADRLHALHRAEVEAVGHRLDGALAANRRLAAERGLTGAAESASYSKVVALLRGQDGGRDE